MGNLCLGNKRYFGYC